MPNDIISSECKDLSISDFVKHVISNDVDLGVTFSLDEKGLRIKVKNPLILEIYDELEITVKGETNIVSKGMNIDTLYDFHGTVFSLNGRNSKQIRDLKSSIEYRSSALEKVEEIKKASESISMPSIDATPNNKLEFLNKLVPKNVYEPGE